MKKKYTVKQIRKKKNLICEAPHRSFDIGKEEFEIKIYGYFNDETRFNNGEEAGGSYYACFMNGLDDNPYCHESIEECYQDAIMMFNTKYIEKI